MPGPPTGPGRDGLQRPQLSGPMPGTHEIDDRLTSVGSGRAILDPTPARIDAGECFLCQFRAVVRVAHQHRGETLQTVALGRKEGSKIVVSSRDRDITSRYRIVAFTWLNP